MDKEKVFGKYHDFILMLTGFLLTGIIGTFISQSYTTKNAELSAANKVFGEYSELAGERYFEMNQILLGLKQGKTKKVMEERWDDYREILQKWNTARGYNRQMLQLYFGQPIWNQERDLHYFFRAWGETLEASFDSSKEIDYDCLFKKRDKFLVDLHSFNFALGQAILMGKIGSNKPTNSVERNPRPEAPCLTNQSTRTQ
ncbi:MULTISPECIES: hypothetical protein [unclassified Shewanella]|uniref:hypothetical protein n=1 Tax=unclassified Shewanella TaxID=196818 RepID=UPI003552E077